eukprot:1145151-Pelagomonas_calceolata.AAC.1
MHEPLYRFHLSPCAALAVEAFRSLQQFLSNAAALYLIHSSCEDELKRCKRTLRWALWKASCEELVLCCDGHGCIQKGGPVRQAPLAQPAFSEDWCAEMESCLFFGCILCYFAGQRSYLELCTVTLPQEHPQKATSTQRTWQQQRQQWLQQPRNPCCGHHRPHN